MYIGQEVESEGNDRSSLDLPGYQNQLLEDVVSHGNLGLDFINNELLETLSILFNKGHFSYARHCQLMSGCMSNIKLELK